VSIRHDENALARVCEPADLMSKRNNFSCLIVDDDAGFISMLAKIAIQEGGRVTSCLDLKSARAEIERAGFDLIILDNRLPDGTGYEFYAEVDRRCPGSVVIMVTGMPELGQAVELTRNGLFEYLTKPLNIADFLACLQRVKESLNHPDVLGASELTGDSPVMREVNNSLAQLARHGTSTVLLLGETGTGKDLAARMLHRLTHASRPPEPAYIPLNCSAVPADMFEAELFGSEKGAYTGAEKRREGLIAGAEGGTLFLDEITETPLPQQAKLLRFLDSHEYRPLGGNALRQFTGRVVAATNRSLSEEVQQGRFREDLMFRLSVATVRLPALRERMADLEFLIRNLLAQLCEKYGRKQAVLKPADMAALRGYHFPGNVRELRNLLERALLRTPENSPVMSFDSGWLSGGNASIPLSFAIKSQPTPPPPERQLNVLELQEYHLIREALRSEDGGIRRAAARLGITHQALMRRLEKWPELRHTAARSN
jgi:DNA-binding NtrC family response regulator